MQPDTAHRRIARSEAGLRAVRAAALDELANAAAAPDLGLAHVTRVAVFVRDLDGRLAALDG